MMENECSMTMQKLCNTGPKNTGKISISLLTKVNNGTESVFS